MPTLLRIPEVFTDIHPQILEKIGAQNPKPLGKDFYLTQNPITIDRATHPAAPFLSWHMPVQHAWPCHPPDIADFPEKAVQALAKKFAHHHPQSVLFSSLTAGAAQNRFRAIAKQMRARAIQLFAPHGALPADEQSPTQPTVFALIGKQGLYAGHCTPAQANGFHPGGRVFLNQSQVISRAGCKVVEALLRLPLHNITLPKNAHWLELGASPGGMTAELLERNFRVTAIDRAVLDPRIANHPQLHFHLADAATFPVATSPQYDALLCDMNGSSTEALDAIARQVPALQKNGIIIFTLKGHSLTTLDDWLTQEAKLQKQSKSLGLTIIDRVHLTHNRHELTLIWQK